MFRKSVLLLAALPLLVACGSDTEETPTPSPRLSYEEVNAKLASSGVVSTECVTVVLVDSALSAEGLEAIVSEPEVMETNVYPESFSGEDLRVVQDSAFTDALLSCGPEAGGGGEAGTCLENTGPCNDTPGFLGGPEEGVDPGDCIESSSTYSGEDQNQGPCSVDEDKNSFDSDAGYKDRY